MAWGELDHELDGLRGTGMARVGPLIDPQRQRVIVRKLTDPTLRFFSYSLSRTLKPATWTHTPKESRCPPSEAPPYVLQL